MRLLQNTVINVAGAIFSLAVTLVTIPAYLHLIGDLRFGVLAILWLLLSYFGLFDLGLGRATSKFIAGLHNSENWERESLFWTALAVNIGFGLVGGALMWFAGRALLGMFFRIPPDLQAEVYRSLPWIAAAVPIATGVSVLTGSLEARERFATVNMLQICGGLAFQLLPLWIAWRYGPNLVPLVASAVLVRVVASLPMLWACHRYIPLQGSVGVHKKWIRDLFSFGGWVTVSGALDPILTSVDRMLVGALLGAQALAYYTVSFNFANKLIILPSSFSRTLFPKFSMLSHQESERLGSEAVLALAIVLTPVVVVAILFLHPFFVLWLGPRIASASSPPAEIFLIGFWITGLAYVPYCSLQARKRPDIVAKFHSAEAIPFVGLVWVGLHFGGVEGAAWAWTFRCAIDALLLIWAARISRKVFILIVPATAAILVARLSIHYSGGHWALACLVTSLILVGYAIWTWVMARPTLTAMLRQGLGLLSAGRSLAQVAGNRG